MDRRAFITVVAGSILAAPLAAQSDEPTYRVGYLASFPLPPDGRSPTVEAVEHGLRDLGYAVGSDLVMEKKSPFGWSQQEESLLALASDFIAKRVDVVVAAWNPAIMAMKRAGAMIPVVMVGAVDPVGHGFVTSLSRPGFNVTGLIWDIGVSRQLELLKEVLPALSRVAVIRESAVGWGSMYWNEAEGAASKRGVRLMSIDVKDVQDFEAAFRVLTQTPVDALVLWDSQLVWRNAGHIMAFAREKRLAVLASRKLYAEHGALISYGVDERALFKQAAIYVHKILKGTKPTDLPVERPVTFELVINGITAKSLGVSIPPSLLQWADVVID